MLLDEVPGVTDRFTEIDTLQSSLNVSVHVDLI
jgi:hypothetical protein